MKRWLLAGAAVALFTLGSVAPAMAEYMKEHRGGTMRIVARSAGGTIDPHINYTLQYWQIYQSIYDGLVNFQKAAGAEGFTKVPEHRRGIAGTHQ